MAADAAPTPLAARLKQGLAKVGLLLGSVLFAVLVTEVVARVAYPKRRSISWYHYDSRYGLRHRASYEAMTTEWGDGEPWQFKSNAHGFRWPEWSLEAPRDARRVLVAGDSFTFGNALPYDQAFPAVAGAEAGSAWQVVNAGTSAWGPSNALAYLETEGAPIEAGCLVYAVFEGNDVLDVMAHGGYALEGGALVSHVDERKVEVTRSSKVREALRGPLYDALLEHSQLFNMLRTGGLNALVKKEAKGKDPSRDTTREQFDRGVELALAVFGRMATLARKRFGGFGLVLIPMRAQIDPSVAEASPDKTAEPFPRWMSETTHERLLAWASRESVPVLDTREVLKGGDVASRFFRRDFHFNAAGSRVVGQALAKALPTLCARGEGPANARE